MGSGGASVGEFRFSFFMVYSVFLVYFMKIPYRELRHERQTS